MALHTLLLKRGRPRPRVTRAFLVTSRPDQTPVRANPPASRGQHTPVRGCVDLNDEWRCPFQVVERRAHYGR
jgi:hypothetical protein